MVGRGVCKICDPPVGRLTFTHFWRMDRNGNTHQLRRVNTLSFSIRVEMPHLWEVKVQFLFRLE